MSSDVEIEGKIAELLQRDLAKQATAFEKLKGGRNSQVFAVDCSEGSRVAVKHYFRSANDPRDRIGCEFRALQFLHEANVTQIAAPLTADQEANIAVYEFIRGTAATSGSIGKDDIDQAIEFLGLLKQFATREGAEHFPPASEACFSIDAVMASVDRRAARLVEAEQDAPELSDFLRDAFEPSRNKLEEWSRDFCRANGIDPGAEIPRKERTLSPSDFGFHNTLRTSDSRLVFLDFEYFGWDDPAKTVSDFLLHPGMELSRELKQRFFAGTLAAFAGVPKLQARIRAVYPLFGLKWCTILLNEFTLDHMRRRRFADRASGVWNQALQLEKARTTLAQTMDDYRDFPYHS